MGSVPYSFLFSSILLTWKVARFILFCTFLASLIHSFTLIYSLAYFCFLLWGANLKWFVVSPKILLHNFIAFTEIIFFSWENLDLNLPFIQICDSGTSRISIFPSENGAFTSIIPIKSLRDSARHKDPQESQPLHSLPPHPHPANLRQLQIGPGPQGETSLWRVLDLLTKSNTLQRTLVFRNLHNLNVSRWFI